MTKTTNASMHPITCSQFFLFTFSIRVALAVPGVIECEAIIDSALDYALYLLIPTLHLATNNKLEVWMHGCRSIYLLFNDWRGGRSFG